MYQTSDKKKRWCFMIPEPWPLKTQPPSILSPSALTTQQDDNVINNREVYCASKPGARSLPDFSHTHEPIGWFGWAHRL